MIRTRIISAAMLFYENDLLMMERSLTRTLNPGMWAVVGGHLEPSEISDPKAACLREIEEETGLTQDDIRDLKLQYILLRLNRNEVRQQFIYTATALKREVAQTDEGDLHWIPREDVLNRDIPFIFRSLLAHYFENGPSPHIWVGTAGIDDSANPIVRWTELIDPGV
ncbi:NUDIX domain-containing protein [Paenibacillus hamazuiensis]|uniref:NUDIX domain-containing protein n=1 Tax=Paenibacillus hamazuiensis TaxID=2936508 RepID=UPI00200DE189|nr:NUDIX domain-containing protein [Paenibacillus hamazuiensis]